MSEAPFLYHLLLLGNATLEQDGQVLDRVVAHRKALALLAIIAAEGSVSRERITSLLWPDSNDERARGSLKQALHWLRRELHAPELIVGSAELRLNPQLIQSDIASFNAALVEGDLVRAVEQYKGPLLEGLHVGNGEFERWLSPQREALAQRYIGALTELAETAETRGDHPSAVQWWRRLQAREPLDSRIAIRLMLALEASGNVAGALAHARVHETMLREELGIGLDPAVTQLIERLLADQKPPDAHTPRPSSALPAAAREIVSADDVARETVEERAGAGGRHGRWVAALAVAVVGIGVGYELLPRRAPPVAPPLAIGWIENEADSAAAETARLLPGLLATNLANVRGLTVISDTRLYEVLGQLDSRQENAQALANAARRAGAKELLEGVLYRQGKRLRLDLRRSDVGTGVVHDVYRADGATAFELVDNATATIAHAFAVRAPRGGFAISSTRSLTARRLYEHGLRAYYRADWRSAHELFAGASAEDSLFAMAALYAGLSKVMGDCASSTSDCEREGAAWMELAARLSEHAPQRDRLFIRLTHSREDYAARLAVAETLTVQFPGEPDGHLALASSRLEAGDFMSSVPHARRVLALDSVGLVGKAASCRACDAYALLVHAYMAADSLAAAQRTAREWIRRQPSSGAAWINLGNVYNAAGKRDSAEYALLQAEKLRSVPEAPYLRARFALHADDYTEAERWLRTRLRYDAADDQALWLLLISLRNQGKMNEAWAIARRGRRDARNGHWVFAEAHAHFELGHFNRAAAGFDSVMHVLDSAAKHIPRGRWARHVSWAGVHLATAWAAAGDTARLQALADTIASIADQSAYGRDWRLPQHVQGLLWLAREQPERAVQSLRAAIYSPTVGYTRTNLELGRVLLERGRAHDAIPVVQAALRGYADGSNYYVTRTELHELLAQAFARAGRQDSAAVHYRKVVRAWSQGDPPFRARAERARKALATQGRL